MTTSEPQKRRGSNTHLKELVAAGLLCYVCETQAPVMRDEVNGMICADCRALYLFILERHQRQSLAEQMPAERLEKQRRRKERKARGGKP